MSTVVSMSCSAMLGIAAMMFTTLMRHRWGRFFTSDREILELTALALPIAGLCELGNCPQTAGCGVLRGSARPTVGANINLGSFYLVGFPVAILMGFVAKMGFAGLWLGLLAAQASCALLMLFVLRRTDWKAEAERARNLKHNLLLLLVIMILCRCRCLRQRPRRRRVVVRKRRRWWLLIWKGFFAVMIMMSWRRQLHLKLTL